MIRSLHKDIRYGDLFNLPADVQNIIPFCDGPYERFDFHPVIAHVVVGDLNPQAFGGVE